LNGASFVPNLKELLYWGEQNSHKFNFRGEENSIMMLALKDNIGYHSGQIKLSCL